VGSVFDNLKMTYSDMFDRTIGPASDGALSASAATAAREAYVDQPDGTPAAARYAAAKTAVANHLAPMTPLAEPAVEQVFDAVHAQPPKPITADTATAQSVSDAARKTATLALGSISGTLKLSGPSLLGAPARVVFGILSALITGGAVYVLYRLADDSKSHPSTAVYIGLAIAIFMAMLTLLLCVTGYSNVNIEGSRGSGKSS
jgi:hypothetical protein